MGPHSGVEITAGHLFLVVDRSNSLPQSRNIEKENSNLLPLLVHARFCYTHSYGACYD